MDRLITRINEIMAKVGVTENGICRRSGSGDDQIANKLYRWLYIAGMTVRRDIHKNIIGRLEGEGPPIVTGSHTLTQ